MALAWDAGFNRRKMEDERCRVAEKKAAEQLATNPQIVADAERLVAVWNERQERRMPMLFAATIGAAIAAGVRPHNKCKRAPVRCGEI